MISLGSLKEQIAAILKRSEFEEILFSAVNLEDTKKGKIIVLLIQTNQELKNFIEKIQASDILPLYKPSKYFSIEKLPILGSRKLDLKAAKLLASELINQTRKS